MTGHDADNDAEHDQCREWRAPGVRRFPPERRQNQKIRVTIEQLQFFAGAKQQQGIANLKTFIGQVCVNSFSFTPDASELDVIAFPEIQLANCFACKPAARVERRIHQSQSFGFEGAEIWRYFRIDLQFL